VHALPSGLRARERRLPDKRIAESANDISTIHHSTTFSSPRQYQGPSEQSFAKFLWPDYDVDQRPLSESDVKRESL